jgi:hypothetical protein
MASSSWIINVRYLSDRTINTAGRIGRHLEHVNAVFSASGMGQNQPFLCRQRLHQTVGTHDFHHPFLIMSYRLI